MDKHLYYNDKLHNKKNDITRKNNHKLILNSKEDGELRTTWWH